jgi:Uma2 family endonuclease
MSNVARQRFTFADYVTLEENVTGVKHEFCDGEVWAMSGGTPEHAALAASVITLLGSALSGKPCRVYSADLRVRVSATGLATYPDVTVICGKLELDPDDPKKLSAVNPVVIVEILSPSTAAYDRGEKLEHYQRVPSLREVVLVAHDRHEIELVRRESDGSWSRHVASEGAAVKLDSLDCELPVNEVYRDPLK